MNDKHEYRDAFDDLTPWSVYVQCIIRAFSETQIVELTGETTKLIDEGMDRSMLPLRSPLRRMAHSIAMQWNFGWDGSAPPHWRSAPSRVRTEWPSLTTIAVRRQSAASRPLIAPALHFMERLRRSVLWQAPSRTVDRFSRRSSQFSPR